MWPCQLVVPRRSHRSFRCLSVCPFFSACSYKSNSYIISHDRPSLLEVPVRKSFRHGHAASILAIGLIYDSVPSLQGDNIFLQFCLHFPDSARINANTEGTDLPEEFLYFRTVHFAVETYELVLVLLQHLGRQLCGFQEPVHFGHPLLKFLLQFPFLANLVLKLTDLGFVLVYDAHQQFEISRVGFKFSAEFLRGGYFLVPKPKHPLFL